MSASFKTILILGGTSGIGEAFTREFVNRGKRVIVTGRRVDRLEQMKKSVPELEIYAMDNTEIEALPQHVKTLTERFPDISKVAFDFLSVSNEYLSNPSGQTNQVAPLRHRMDQWRGPETLQL
jgi:uncharacterized oxidoreductase